MTRILALETSHRQGSLAILEGGAAGCSLVREVQLPVAERTAQTFAPALKALLAEAEWSATSVQLTAVTTGPGSFTGLRIGVTAAKTWAYATGAEILGVGTLDVLAAQVPPLPGSRLWAVLDAQRDELFAASYTMGEASAGWTAAEPVAIVAREAWLAGLGEGDLVTGPILERIAPQLPGGVTAVERALWTPLASTVGMLAWQAYQAGRRDDLWQLVPHYYRQSAAEEKWQARQGK